MATPVAGLDVDALVAHLRQHLPIDGDVRVELLQGGRSNLTYRLTMPEVSWVLRRPPLGIVAPSANDVRREFTVLRGLADSPVPVPEAVHLCEEASVLGVPFSVMSFVEGRVVRSDADARALGPAAAEHARSLVEELAVLHAVDPAAVGLEMFGRPDGYLARQVDRWSRQWEIVKTRDLPALTELHRQLVACTPTESRTSIVHGDYRIDNVLFEPGTPRIAALLDWEMSTLGDPLSDLATLVVYWDPLCAPLLADGHPTSANPAFPTAAEVIDLYASVAGVELGDLSFHRGLACFKLAVIAEGIHRRFVDGDTVGDDFDHVGDAVAPLVATGLEVLGSGH
jgi:aminoglycoside phosphotransferase (APT) family kinase protein